MNKQITTGNSTEGIEVINTKPLAYVAPEKPVITLATADTIKDTAIAFVEWVSIEWEFLPVCKRWYYKPEKNIFMSMTTEQLYEQFLKEKE